MKKLQGVYAFMVMGYFGGLMAYVPRNELIHDVIQRANQQASSTNAASVFAGGVPEQNFAPVPIEERDGFACINGFEAFNQVVVQASSAHPVVVFFFAQKDVASQILWVQLQKLAKNPKVGEHYVAVDIFQNSEGQPDNQNYQLAVRCMETTKIPSFPLPVVLFFKNGLMCTAQGGVLIGSIKPVQVTDMLDRIAGKKGKEQISPQKG